ncbi:hypothetical protein Daus18300_001201 [Diaporthe australafricana]|uniref:BTB domain-containing protein n=1 Tax=Diaporthe australafricana TaxID=127596 RepID=A0ABR3XZA0_9PEZI
MPLPDTIPDSPDIVASSINDSDTDGASHTGEADDVLAPLPSDICSSVSKTDNSTTISEPTATVAVHEDLSSQQNTTSELMSSKNISDKTSGNPEPTAPTDVIPSQKPESVTGKVDEIELDRLALQQKVSDETGGRSTSPENAASTDPTEEVSVDGGDESNNDGSKTPVGNSTDIASNGTASPKDAKFVDPNDKVNNGNVIQFFFTSSTRKRPSSPVTSAPGCCNPRLDRDSDLYVKAKGEDGTVFVFEVVSAILDKASPKFEAMIFGTHKRGNREEWVWELEDNPALVASKPNPSQLSSVLQVFDKYEVKLEDTNYHLFAASWIDGFRNGLATSKLSTLEAFQVAYKIGDFKSTKALIRDAAHEISDEEGKRLLDFPIQQQGVLATLEAIRNEDLKFLLNALKVPFEYLMDASKVRDKHYCKSVDDHFECNQKLLGSLLANLVQQSLFPIPEPANYKGSVSSLIAKMEKMEIRGLYYPHIEMTKQRHCQCKLGQAGAIEEVKGKDGKRILPLSDDLLEDMYFASKRSGLLRKEKKEFEPYKDRLQDIDFLCLEEFKKDIWGWYDPTASESDTTGNSSDDSGIFDVIDTSVWVERKVSG